MKWDATQHTHAADGGIIAKKDTYLALLRRGIDETTSMTLAEAGLKVGDIKKLTKEQLIGNYGLKSTIAEGVLEAMSSGPSGTSRHRFLTGVLARPKPMDKIEEARFRREQKDVTQMLTEERERLKNARVESFRSQKVIMNRLGKTIELIVKLERNFEGEYKDEQRVKIRDQLETRGLEAARDHEMLNLPGAPQDIVDFRRHMAPRLCQHACPECGEEIDPRGNLNMEDPDGWSYMCWECGHDWEAPLISTVQDRLDNGTRIRIDASRAPRELVPQRPVRVVDSMAVVDIIAQDLERTGADADRLVEVAKTTNLTGGLMSIYDWIDQTLAAKGYIQSQEDREDFILRTGAGATKFNKWMKKAGLNFNKQLGRWTRYPDN